jgi:hypothetical protein
VWISGNDDGSCSVALSPNASESVLGILEGCGDLNNVCYQNVLSNLVSADLEFDSNANRRRWLEAMVSYGTSTGIVFAGLTSYFIAIWHLKHTDDEFSRTHQFPVPVLVEGTVFATATPVAVSAEGSALVTITPTPGPTTVKG